MTRSEITFPARFFGLSFPLSSLPYLTHLILLNSSMSTRIRRLSLPTSVLPKLSRNLSANNLTSQRILDLIQHLRTLYAPSNDTTQAHPTDEEAKQAQFSHEEEEDETVDPLHQWDQLERSWAVNWLSLIVKRGEEWIEEAQENGTEQEKDLRCEIVDQAAGLVAHLSATSGT